MSKLMRTWSAGAVMALALGGLVASGGAPTTTTLTWSR